MTLLLSVAAPHNWEQTAELKDRKTLRELGGEHHDPSVTSAMEVRKDRARTASQFYAC